jgi:Protein of unknown function (DUF4242)
MAAASSARTFLVECYSPGVHPADVRAASERASVAAGEIQGEGRAVQYLSAMLMARDEVVFHVFAASDEDAVREAAVRARLPFERVVESIAITATAAPPMHREPGPDAPGAG